MKHVAFHNCPGEVQISSDYLKLLDQRYNKYLNSVCAEVNYSTSVKGKEENVDTLENQLLTFVKSIIKEYD